MKENWWKTAEKKKQKKLPTPNVTKTFYVIQLLFETKKKKKQKRKTKKEEGKKLCVCVSFVFFSPFFNVFFFIIVAYCYCSTLMETVTEMCL